MSVRAGYSEAFGSRPGRPPGTAKVDSATADAALRRALESGSFEPLTELYSDTAALDASLPGERLRVRGPERIGAALAARFGTPARIVEWSSKLHPEGVELWVERVDADGRAVRQRQYLELSGGAVSRHWIYAAPPRTRPPAASPESEVGVDPTLIAHIGAVRAQEPLVSRGWSGSALVRLVLEDGTRLIAKRVQPVDWLSRRTRDPGREALLFRCGVLDRVPAAIDHAIVAAERDGDAWWVVMRDVSDLVLPDGARLSREESRRILAAANGMWEEFWGEEVPYTVPLALRIGVTGRKIAELERDGVDLLPKQFEAFWEAFTEAVPPDVAEPVLKVVEDPSRLVAELDACGTTLIHSDIRDEQIGVTDNRVILLDWGGATQGHPVVDFYWSISHNAWRIDATHDEIEADFRRVRGDADDPRALDLGAIAGLAMYGWIFGHSAAYHPDPAERRWAREELDWWVPRVRRALETWSPP